MPDSTEPSRMPLIILRVAIVVIAALELYWFRDGYRLSWEMLAPPYEGPWFNYLFAFLVGIVAPGCALAAAGLAIAGKRLGLALILLCVAVIAYWVPPGTMIIGIMIYGF
jgi:hypothetical protein